MHSHVVSFGPTALPLYLANGVTSIRDMGAERFADAKAWRDSIAAGQLLGPRMRIASPVVENPDWLAAVKIMTERAGTPWRLYERVGLTSADEAARWVDSLAALDPDHIKVRNWPRPDIARALVERARQRGLPVAGHGNEPFPRTGVETLEHGIWPPLAVPNADREALWRQLAAAGTALVPTLVTRRVRLESPDAAIERLSNGAVAGWLQLSVGDNEPRRHSSNPIAARKAAPANQEGASNARTAASTAAALHTRTNAEQSDNARRAVCAAAATLIAAVVAFAFWLSRPVAVAAYDDSADDHIVCALSYPATFSYDADRAAQNLAPPFTPIVDAVGVSHGAYEVIDAHMCPCKGRNYANVVFRGGGQTLSLFAERAERGRLPAASATTLTGDTIDVHGTTRLGYRIAAVATRDYELFLVSERPTEPPEIEHDILRSAVRFIRQLAE